VLPRPGGGRRLRARYAFSGAGPEIDRPLPLAPDEQVLPRGAVRTVEVRQRALRLTWLAAPGGHLAAGQPHRHRR